MSACQTTQFPAAAAYHTHLQPPSLPAWLQQPMCSCAVDVAVNPAAPTLSCTSFLATHMCSELIVRGSLALRHIVGHPLLHVGQELAVEGDDHAWLPLQSLRLVHGAVEACGSTARGDYKPFGQGDQQYSSMLLLVPLDLGVTSIGIQFKPKASIPVGTSCQHSSSAGSPIALMMPSPNSSLMMDFMASPPWVMASYRRYRDGS